MLWFAILFPFALMLMIGEIKRACFRCCRPHEKQANPSPSPAVRGPAPYDR